MLFIGPNDILYNMTVMIKTNKLHTLLYESVHSQMERMYAFWSSYCLIILDQILQMNNHLGHT